MKTAASQQKLVQINSVHSLGIQYVSSIDCGLGQRVQDICGVDLWGNSDRSSMVTLQQETTDCAMLVFEGVACQCDTSSAAAAIAALQTKKTCFPYRR